jgi:hypothetical protein
MTWARRALPKRRLLITHILKSHLSSLTLWRLEEDKRRALRCPKYSSLCRTLSHHLQIKASSHNSIHSYQNPYSKHTPAHHITPLFILALHTQNNQQPTNQQNKQHNRNSNGIHTPNLSCSSTLHLQPQLPKERRTESHRCREAAQQGGERRIPSILWHELPPER